MSFFSPLPKIDHSRVVAAIAAAESHTSGEIRVVIARHPAADPGAAAQRQFERLGMTHTKARNGVLIFLAGLQSIGQEVYEAAEIDGVGPIGKFLYIELPLILTQVRLSLVLLIVATLGGYGLQLQLLNEYGGPGGRGMVPGLWMYNRAFYAGEFGYACAIGMILFAFILLLTFVNNRYVRIEK